MGKPSDSEHAIAVREIHNVFLLLCSAPTAKGRQNAADRIEDLMRLYEIEWSEINFSPDDIKHYISLAAA